MGKKGYHHTAEARAKISAAMKNRVASPETNAKIADALRGRPRSPETKAKLSLAHKGKKRKPLPPEVCEKISLAQKGKKRKPLSAEQRAKISAASGGWHHTPETIAKISEASKKQVHCHHTAEAKRKIGTASRGEKNANWRGGISFEPYCPKFNNDLKNRVRAFFDYKCILCGRTKSENKNRSLSVHHVEYNKRACCDDSPAQFASTCMRCHQRTNSDREHWEHILHVIIDTIYNGKSYYTKEEMKSMEV
jgi:hypothetical protein